MVVAVTPHAHISGTYCSLCMMELADEFSQAAEVHTFLNFPHMEYYDVEAGSQFLATSNSYMWFVLPYGMVRSIIHHNYAIRRHSYSSFRCDIPHSL